MVSDIIDFEIPKVSPSIIMVAGVGGGGSNAVNYMFERGIKDVSFMVCNTDRQALYRSPVPIKVRLGENLTEGLGAGNNPEQGRAAALESLDEITDIFRREGTKMVFITAGMGGGTGTGAAPVIAKAAKEMGILTVGIVTLPFKTEGNKRTNQAYKGVEELKEFVDSLLLINNESIHEIYGKLTLTDAFGKANDILATAARGIAEIITRPSTVNVDFADIKTVMTDSGVALMGSGRANGPDRALEVSRNALTSPLLNHNDIYGATNILINITSGGDEITFEEVYQITEYIQERAGNEAEIIWGAGRDESLESDIEVTIIATGFNISALAQVHSSQPRSVVPTRHVVVPKTVGATLPGAVPQNRPAAPQAEAFVLQAGSGNYENIDELENSPAWVRRRVDMTQCAAPADDPKGRIALNKDKKTQKEDGGSSNSLF